MTVATLRADLGLLGRSLAHPVQQWERWRDLAVELFRDGGATIDTPPAAEHQPIAASTVIQADGDVLVFVDDAALADEALLDLHRRRVAEWYEQSRATVRQGVVAARAAAFTISGAVAATGGLITDALVNRALALVVFPTLLTAGGWVGGLVVHAVLQRRIGRVLRGLGVRA